MNAHPRWPHDRQLHAWWVTPELLAGEYPGDTEPGTARGKLGLLVDAGITSIVDLTTADDHLLSYAEHLPATISRTRFPIPDRSVIDDAGYDAIVAHIDREISAGGRVYVHCWGGVGRTSTVIACVLGAGGMTLDESLDRIAELRADTRKSHRPFLETGAQHEFINRRFADPGADWQPL